MQSPRPLVLLILDGWGVSEPHEFNMISEAKTPTYDELVATYPNTTLGASGADIGLAPGHQGSTEMGHLIISAGRNIFLPQMQISAALESEHIGDIPAYAEAIQMVKKRGSRLHLMGLLSNAGVHSYDALAHHLLQAAADAGLQSDQVYIHIFSDGRDTPPLSLPEHIDRLKIAIQRTGVGRVATLQGRFWAMDRDHNWDRIERAYQLLTKGIGRPATSIDEAMNTARVDGESDEFIEPTIIDPEGVIRDNDVVINWNYRVDREIEITQAFIEPEFTTFDRGRTLDIHYVAAMPYYEGMPAPSAFQRTELKVRRILPEILAEHKLKQYRVTETEKWPYVTKIFNGMRENSYPNETRHLIPSDTVQSFHLQPEMKAMEIAQDIAAQLRAGAYDVIISNICNADMIGHTGNHAATRIGCEAIDEALQVIVDAVRSVNGILVITADHGNAEQLWDRHHDLPHTQHTLNRVPCIIVDEMRKGVQLRDGGTLKDVAPTVLDLLGIYKPAEMTGRSLLQKEE